MRIPRIYLPTSLSTGQSVELTEQTFQHVIKVLRLKQDSKLKLFDGAGAEFSACIEVINKKSASVKILDSIQSCPESELYIHLGLGISKGERMDYAIQKAVELGVTEITPLFTEHCIVNLDEKRIKKRLQHWQGIIVSACEQCGRTILPVLNSATSLNQWTKTVKETCIVFDPLASDTLNKISIKDNRINLVIGPEGGLSSEEISGITKNIHFKNVKFGPRILRTETAAVSAITAIQVLWGDLLK